MDAKKKRLYFRRNKNLNELNVKGSKEQVIGERKKVTKRKMETFLKTILILSLWIKWIFFLNLGLALKVETCK